MEGSGIERESSGEGKVLSPNKESFMNESSISSSIIRTSSGAASGIVAPGKASGVIVWSASSSGAMGGKGFDVGEGGGRIGDKPCALR